MNRVKLARIHPMTIEPLNLIALVSICQRYFMALEKTNELLVIRLLSDSTEAERSFMQSLPFLFVRNPQLNPIAIG